MEQILTKRPEIQLIGTCVRTSYEKERDSNTGSILPCVQNYFHNALFEKILNRKNPGATFCAYTDYESDYKGAYTYFIGEEVTAVPTQLPGEFSLLTIPGQNYAKFTTLPAPMPEVLMKAWQAIWNMSSDQLGGKRSYHTDFEIYDERASDHQNIVMDLYIGINPQ